MEPLNELAVPTLMRAARGAYAQAIRAQLQATGFDDLPRNGAFILAGVDGAGGARPDLAGELGVTKQAVSQAVDVLVNRGYVTRRTDPDDRRRVTLELTGVGRRALEAVVRGVDAVDAQLSARLSADQVEAMRAGLIALAQIKVTDRETGAPPKRPARLLRSFSPIFPVRDLALALRHYEQLGFRTLSYEGGAGYGFANRDGIGLHLAADHEPGHPHEHPPSATYLYVRDADALYEEWTQPGIGGRTQPVEDTPYHLREGAHTDPDGNVIRFGSPVDE